MKLEGRNVYLRESSFDDCTDFAKWEQRPEVTEFFTIDKSRNYEEVVREFIERQPDPTQVQLTICSKETDAPIGRIYISRIDNHYDSLDITRIYIAEKQMRGRGLGEDALRTVLDYAFNVCGCERVTLDYFTGNEIASSLYRKVGFVDEGTMRHGGKKDGKYVDLNLMSILKEEYMSSGYYKK